MRARHLILTGALLLLGAGCSAPKTSVVPAGKAGPGERVQLEAQGFLPLGSAGSMVRFGPAMHVSGRLMNVPAHGEILASPPQAVSIGVDAAVSQATSVRVERDGRDWGLGATALSDDGMTFSRRMDPAAPDGVYMVLYVSCAPDGSCRPGRYEFAVDRTRLQEDSGR